jgi:glycosyltransferase involved in cell wall biosynthesis
MTGNNQHVSVITACRNARSLIGKALDSVHDQSGPAEHLVVDAASTDGTVDLLKERTRYLSWWCSEPDGGISDAFNKGIRHAKGEIVGILNADDWYEPGALATIRGAFSNTNVDVVHGQVRYWEDGRPLRVADGSHAGLLKSGSVNHPSVFVRRSLYGKFGLFDTSYRYAMDYELMLRWLVRGVRYTYVPKVLANMSLGGISDRRRIEALREVRRAQRQHLGRPLADAQHLLLVGRYRIRQAMEHLGFNRLIALQRRHNRGMRSVSADGTR